MPSPRPKKQPSAEKIPSEEPTAFRVGYQVRPDRPTFPVSGAYGGPTPGGTHVVAHFFTEYNSIPDVLVGDPEDGVVKSENMRAILRTNVTREVLGTAMMPPAVAERVGEWLIKKAEAAREAAQLQVKEDEK